MGIKKGAGPYSAFKEQSATDIHNAYKFIVCFKLIELSLPAERLPTIPCMEVGFEAFAFAGDNLMSMLLKPSYTTQDSEKVDEEPDHQQSTITKMLNAASIKPPPPPV